MIVIKNNRPDFRSLFVSHLDSISKLSSSQYSWWDEYDDYYGDDYDYWGHGSLFHGCCGDDDINGFSNVYGTGLRSNKRGKLGSSSSSKRGKRGGRGKKGRCVPLYDEDWYEHGDDDVVYPKQCKEVRYSDDSENLFASNDDGKMIYYYSDMNNPDDNVSIFYSVYDFDKFLDEEGIHVDKCIVDELLSRSISHCCINPLIGDRLSLMCDTSFGGLHYQYAENNDDLLEAENKLVGHHSK